ncbi:benzoate/H(+) symporter BenE family transporter [Pacificibacter sp. AS14]|uniref:benzoate/H(+) symporter BenE family transporter n=1 Tax=Pacificibacter sp. AS14 TaxID=3135785 RepID=UPI00317A4595
MFRDFTLSAALMGLLAAFVGYAASFTIVLTGMLAMGASPDQATTGLFFATLGMGICSIVIPFLTRTPAAIAWSTPGAAFLASSVVLPGGFAEAAGALIICAVLILITGLLPALARAVAAIPKPIANALLAGVLLKLCFAPAIGLGVIPLMMLPVLAAWLIGVMWNKLAAMPFAVIAFVAVLIFGVDLHGGAATSSVALLPEFTALHPVFSLHAMISVALPMYLVTMAGQNIPGFAVMELNDYPVNRAGLIRGTGLASLLIAPFGAIPVNMSAITAAMMAGDDAGRDPSKRYWAAIISGLVYVTLAFATTAVAGFASLAPAELITGVAGLALIPALVGSLSGAFSHKDQMEAPALTFLIAASGMALFGVSGAFWGVLVGGVVWSAKGISLKRRS